MKSGKRLWSTLQGYVPQRYLSQGAGWLGKNETPWLKNALIRAFIRHYKIDLTEAERTDYQTYRSFNDFFTRTLKTATRPLADDPNAIISPVDGTISEIGQLDKGQILQAKGHVYSVTELLGGDQALAAPFAQGNFLTAYLAPYNYHRFHMPIEGTLKEMLYIPGKLFSVNTATVADIKNIFALNERVVCFFDTPIGPMAYIAVGAMLVGSIHMSFHGAVNSVRGTACRWPYAQENLHFARGDELGYFSMGSTVIILFGDNVMEWKKELSAGKTVVMGEMIGSRINY